MRYVIGLPRTRAQGATPGVRRVCRGGGVCAHGLVALRAQPRVVGGDNAELRQQGEPPARRKVS